MISTVLLTGILAAAIESSQQPASARPAALSDTDYAEPPPPPDARQFFMPDVPDSWYHYSSYDGRTFSTRLSLVPIVDFTVFGQDDDSVKQVGAQKSEWDLRTFRIMARGALKLAHPVQYFVSLEVKGTDHVQNEASRIGFTDLFVATELGPLGTLTYGKVKEPWVYEMVGDAANLQQQERILSPFFVSRGIGLRLSKPIAHDRMTVAGGWFNDWYVEEQSFEESGNQFSGRVTGVPFWKNEGADYVHLGISARYDGGDDGVLRFRGRPESNISSYYVDSGDIDADHASELGLEAAWGRGPLFVTSEYVHASIDSPANAHPDFWGAYLVASWVLTGEHRPYDRKVGYARRVMPQRRIGAWEVFVRYSHLDIDDRIVKGGTLDKGTAGLSWWATRRWKVGADYGLSDLDRFGISGRTDALHLRMQWIY